MSKPLVFVAAAAVTIVIVMFWGRVLAFLQDRPAAASVAFAPDPKSDKRIVVRGWSEDELQRILEDFAKLYELPRSFASQTHTANSENAFVAFPDDIPSDVFFFLVNYLNYPERYELKGRQIAVVGKATLTSAFDVPDSSLLGKPVRVYAPKHDEDFDLVYVTLASGESYEISFTDHRWKVVQDSRMPDAVREL